MSGADLLGWAGAYFFFYGCWLMGDDRPRVRRDGMLCYLFTNTFMGTQAVAMHNWPLLVLSAGGFLLQFRAWLKWRSYDVRRDDLRSD